MIAVKNRDVKVDNRSYEIFFTTHDAQHISDHISSPYDTGSHLNFIEIEEVVSNNNFFSNRGKDRYYFLKKINNKKYMVAVFLKGRRCIIKSGRICNFNDLINDSRWESF